MMTYGSVFPFVFQLSTADVVKKPKHLMSHMSYKMRWLDLLHTLEM